MPAPSPRGVCVVVAVRDEELSIPPFLAALRREFAARPQVSSRVIFVEDGSRDATRRVIERAADADPDIDFVFLKRGGGQAAALTIGLERARAEAVDAIVMMDVDGEHPVTVVGDMLDRFMLGDDLVQGSRAVDSDRRHAPRRLASAVFIAFMRLAAGVDLRRQNVYFRLATRRVLDTVWDDPRWFYFLRFNATTFRKFPSSFVEYRPPPRRFGESKFNWTRLLRLAVEGALAAASRRRLVAWLVLLGAGFAGVAASRYWALAVFPLAFSVYLSAKLWTMRRRLPSAGLEIETQRSRLS